MPPEFMINPIQFGIELVSTILIAILAIIIFHKTKEMYVLSGKKSINMFRYSFLFFGLAYITRFFLMSSKVTLKLFDMARQNNKIILMIGGPLLVFFSLTAILSLTSSIIKRLQNKKHLLMQIIIIGFVMSIVGMIFESIMLLVLIQLILFIVSFIIIRKQSKQKKKRKNQFQNIYFLLFFAWIMSTAILIPFKFKIPHELMIIPHLISIIIFAIILKKITKLIK